MFVYWKGISLSTNLQTLLIMGTIIKLGLPIFFAAVLFRLLHIDKEKKQLKMAMKDKYSENMARHYRHLIVFQMVMYGLGALAALFFIYLAWIR